MFCSTCGDERLFEQPPCSDGHGEDCPERACTACGTAILIGLPVAPPAILGHAPPSTQAPPAASSPRRTSDERAVA
ncbi:hypothetical protein J4573_15605 [Actinomadura barringtoniae]|uniref:Uncharacterized protein n=1 Tax=Actinomadura barringtoniae TaxID=1427535 RepID=A0A939P9X0_9ACTN|nr:hypothetical protein [Actinomadura barringtoniae]MBO2448528.1 hypothetical protein [Actinomadura barringtoniae]